MILTRAWNKFPPSHRHHFSFVDLTSVTEKLALCTLILIHYYRCWLCSSHRTVVEHFEEWHSHINLHKGTDTHRKIFPCTPDTIPVCPSWAIWWNNCTTVGCTVSDWILFCYTAPEAAAIHHLICFFPLWWVQHSQVVFIVPYELWKSTLKNKRRTLNKLNKNQSTVVVQCLTTVRQTDLKEKNNSDNHVWN